MNIAPNGLVSSTFVRVLHITTELPLDVAATGGATRQFELLSVVAAGGHDVTVVAPVFPFQRALDPVERLGRRGIDLKTSPRHARREGELLSALLKRPHLLSAAVGLPYYALQTEVLMRGMAPVIREALLHGPAVAIIEHDFAALVRRVIPQATPCVLATQNVTSAYYRLRGESQHGIQKRAAMMQATLMERYLQRWLPEFQSVIAVSLDDAAEFRTVTRGRIDIVPNGSDASATSLVPVRAGSQTVLFTGTMSHPPNHDGIRWFHNKIWPVVRNAIPTARLAVVGRSPRQAVRDLGSGDPSTIVTGAVESMVPYYEDAAIVVAPLRSGGGTRLKILDAFAAGRAVVSTTVGCAGLEVNDGVHLHIADDPGEFAGKVIRLLNHPQEAARLAYAGRRLLQAKYDWTSLGSQFEAILVDLAA